MEVRCDKCQARYRVADEKVGPQGLTMKCGKCGNQFRVARNGAPVGAAQQPLPLGLAATPAARPQAPRSNATGASGLPPAGPASPAATKPQVTAANPHAAAAKPQAAAAKSQLAPAPSAPAEPPKAAAGASASGPGANPAMPAASGIAGEGVSNPGTPMPAAAPVKPPVDRQRTGDIASGPSPVAGAGHSPAQRERKAGPAGASALPTVAEAMADIGSTADAPETDPVAAPAGSRGAATDVRSGAGGVPAPRPGTAGPAIESTAGRAVVKAPPRRLMFGIAGVVVALVILLLALGALRCAAPGAGAAVRRSQVRSLDARAAAQVEADKDSFGSDEKAAPKLKANPGQ